MTKNIFHSLIRRKGEFQKYSEDDFQQYYDKNQNFNPANFLLPEKFSDYENNIFIIPREGMKRKANMFLIKIGNYFFQNFFHIFSFEKSDNWFNLEKIDYLFAFNEILFHLSQNLNFKVGKEITLKYYNIVLKLL